MVCKFVLYIRIFLWTSTHTKLDLSIWQEQKLCVNMSNKQFNYNFNIRKKLNSLNSMKASCLFSWKFDELRIFKLYRKTILQQTPSSDTQASGTPLNKYENFYITENNDVTSPISHMQYRWCALRRILYTKQTATIVFICISTQINGMQVYIKYT